MSAADDEYLRRHDLERLQLHQCSETVALPDVAAFPSSPRPEHLPPFVPGLDIPPEEWKLLMDPNGVPTFDIVRIGCGRTAAFYLTLRDGTPAIVICDRERWVRHIIRVEDARGCEVLLKRLMNIQQHHFPDPPPTAAPPCPKPAEET